jgi:isopenicillin N synthase-like dioxygenase
VVTTSLTTKARLLHYFPAPETETEANKSGVDGEGDDDDDWCATHIDHGCLTGLTSAMFLDEATSSPALPSAPSSSASSLPLLHELPRSPDPQAGLYISSRTGDIVKVNIPKDCLAFQTGEALQLITQGRFRAVPHFVRGARRPDTAEGGSARIARNTLAVFTQPNLAEEVQKGVSFGEFARGVVQRNY